MAPLCFEIRPAAGRTGVAETLRTRPDVDDIRILNGWFGDDDAEELGPALAGNTSLKKLVLYKCSIRARGLRSIAEALKVNKTLTILSLKGTKIFDAGAAIVADALVSNSSLTVLALGNCGIALHWSWIGVHGLKDIAKALEINTSLRDLHMGDNKIGDAGALALADALASTKSLFYTNLLRCGIGEQGAMALGRAWGTNLALPLNFHVILGVDGVQEEATRIRGLVLERRDKLLSFGMATIPRLAGSTSADAEPDNTSSSSEVREFCFMNKDVFRLIGEAYGDY